jgi:hypothetical protein
VIVRARFRQDREPGIALELVIVRVPCRLDREPGIAPDLVIVRVPYPRNPALVPATDLALVIDPESATDPVHSRLDRATDLAIGPVLATDRVLCRRGPVWEIGEITSPTACVPAIFQHDRAGDAPAMDRVGTTATTGITTAGTTAAGIDLGDRHTAGVTGGIVTQC